MYCSESNWNIESGTGKFNAPLNVIVFAGFVVAEEYVFVTTAVLAMIGLKSIQSLNGYQLSAASKYSGNSTV